MPAYLETLHFFGVFDGHGGAEAALHCAQTLHQRIVEAISEEMDSTTSLGTSFIKSLCMRLTHFSCTGYCQSFSNLVRWYSLPWWLVVSVVVTLDSSTELTSCLITAGAAFNTYHRAWADARMIASGWSSYYALLFKLQFLGLLMIVACVLAHTPQTWGPFHVVAVIWSCVGTESSHIDADDSMGETVPHGMSGVQSGNAQNDVDMSSGGASTAGNSIDQSTPTQGTEPKSEGVTCNSASFESALQSAFNRTDEEFGLLDSAALVGTTAVVTLVGSRQLYIANCGKQLNSFYHCRK